jgi:hypothetical protein
VEENADPGSQGRLGILLFPELVDGCKLLFGNIMRDAVSYFSI